MKKLLIIFAAWVGCASVQAQEIHDANAEPREVKSFHGIHVSSAFNVYLTQGNDEAVAVSAADEKSRERIKVEVKDDGILYISFDSQGRWGNGNRKLKAYISFRKIDRLMISGACDVFTSGEIKADDLYIELSGASDLRTAVTASKLTIDLGGASDMKISGRALQLAVTATGASNFKGYDLESETCEAVASGASDIRITVSKELSAHATGASDIHYKGDGTVRDLKNSGSSSISRG